MDHQILYYTSANNYIKRTFGRKLYKISIDGGFTCPNRDGSLSTGGCIFCSMNGSGDFAGERNTSITAQIEAGKEQLKNKFKAKPGQDKALDSNMEASHGSYIAYFQAYTNTYAPIDELRKKYMEAVYHPDIAVISIATRPDCLSSEVIALLDEINHVKPVWVELGLQTIHESTAEYIRRGFSLDVYDIAVARLNAIGISQIIVHVILGLPGESNDMILDTVKYVVNSGASGIKLQLLHVLDVTDLARDYETGLFKCLSLDEYISLIKSCIEIIPKDIVVHRITGDGPKKLLIAPLWSGNKKLVLNTLSTVVRPYY